MVDLLPPIHSGPIGSARAAYMVIYSTAKDMQGSTRLNPVDLLFPWTISSAPCNMIAPRMSPASSMWKCLTLLPDAYI